jgi:dihydrofolate synthase/folylpolyglutamate synthase
MTYDEALEFIHAADWKGSNLGLERISELCALLGDPQKKLKFVHVAGTNGKGSTCAMLSAILTAAGYKTGLFTSPHLQRYNERFKINGEDITDEAFCEATETIKKASEGMSDAATEFERCTAIGLEYFAQQGCDIVVFEVGLGGRLDSTNVIDAPEAAVITNLGLEHTEVLGDTIEQIAAEKAGIIKPGCSVVLYAQSPEAEAVVKQKAADCGCTVSVTDPSAEKLLSEDVFGQHIDYKDRRDLELKLLGTYQYSNCALVLETVDALKARGWNIPEEAVREGLRTVNWPGRFEVLQKEPLIILDGAHNPNGVQELAHCIERFLPGRKLRVVMGVMADKDHAQMIDIMAPYAERFVAMQPKYYRSMKSDALAAEIAERTGLPVTDAGDVETGVRTAKMMADTEHPVVIFGSLYQIGEIMDAMAGRSACR